MWRRFSVLGMLLVTALAAQCVRRSFADDPPFIEQPVGAFTPEIEPALPFEAQYGPPPEVDSYEPTPPTHGIVYDNGWIFRPYDPEATPFELKISLQNQFRHTGFANEEPAVINSAGTVVPTPPLNTFDINRGRLILSGYALDPNLEYYTNFDYNTVSEDQFQVLMAWLRYVFAPGLKVSYGIGKVPGTWEWMEAARSTLGAERTLATTFFRPSMTTGLWAEGEPSPGLYYHALIGNGFNTFSLRSAELDTNFVYSGMLWTEPLGSFGDEFSDFDQHDQLVVRLGTAITYNREAADLTGDPGPEQTGIRLSDGTRLVETGALAPGVTVERFDLSLYTAHAGLKYAGFSLSGEYFLRWLSSIRADGAIPDDSIFDHGFFAQSGIFVRPQSMELFARGSAVFGPFGDGSEVAGGLNWFVGQRRNHRFTFDVARILDSPTQQDRTGFLAGASGWLFRTQFWISF